MTLDEAIKHAEVVAKDHDKLCKRYDDASGYTRSHNKEIRTSDAKRCEEYAKEQRQLAEWLKDYKRLLEQEQRGDLISRQAVLDDFWKLDIELRPSAINAILNMVKELPSVNPQEPKVGHWSRKTKVDAYDIAGVKTWGIKCQCDRCDFTTIVVEDFGYYNYCPNCGARMVKQKESEEV